MGKRQHANDFTVDTNSQCFICFEKIPYGFSTSVNLGETGSDGSSIHSLQHLSRYLKLDMRKVFHEEESIPPHLLAQVEKSRLKVELCEDCGQMNESFSKQCIKLQKIEMEVQSSLRHIHRKFQEAMETNKTAQFQNLNDGAGDFNGKIEIANALRSEALVKSKLQLGRPFPLVRIQKMSKKQAMACQRRNKLNSRNLLSEPNRPLSLNLGDNLANVKEEISIQRPNQDDIDENEYFNDSHSNLHTSDVDMDDPEFEYEANVLDDPDPTRSKSKASMQGIVYRGSVGEARNAGAPNKIEGEKCTINPKTGKYKCKICSMEFKPRGFRYHYRSVHLGIKYKCNLCEKEFSRRPNYNTHHKTVHKGMSSSFSVVNVSAPSRENVESSFYADDHRHRCDLRPGKFASADDLQIHYTSAHPDVKYRCKLCYKEFDQFPAYRQHQCSEPKN